MIKAKEAQSMSISAELDERILDKICRAIITATSKGKYSVDIPLDNSRKYMFYLKTLGYDGYYLSNMIHITWELI